MSKDKGPWRDGRRAWERLAFWYPGGGPVADSPERDPLAALGDVGLMRRLLDETELEAVRSARRRGLSWAEIATKLGVSRQSAWERWRDLDTDPPAPAPAATSVAASEAEIRRGVLGRASRQRFVRVPHVVGKTVEQAHNILDEHGLLAVSADPDGPPPAVLQLGQLVVSGQNPDHGAKVPVGTAVKLWTERGGGSGVREPRRPKPTPLAERELPDEALGVG